MGILGTLVKKTVGKAVERTVGYAAAEIGIQACYKAKKRLEEGNPSKDAEFLSGVQEGHSRLIVGQKPYTFKESFSIFDEKEKVKYIVKGKLISATHNLTVYDATGENVLGRVKEKLISVRSPLSFESHPKDFIIEMGGKKLGKMKSRFAFGKSKFEFTFNKWVLEGNILGLKYKLLNEKKEKIMDVSSKVWVIGDTYYLDITDHENELLCVLILLAIDSSQSSKSNDNRRIRRHNDRQFKRKFLFKL